MFEKIFKQKEMPRFAIYSRLDKNLLKLMLIRATELDDKDIAEYRLKYFNPEKDDRVSNYHSHDPSSQQTAGYISS